jgi:hypothetical protein
MAIYALLIGINGYPVKPLNGCIRDVDDVEAYLKATYASAVKTRRLTDKKDAAGKLVDLAPTRNNIIEAFTFFADAKDKDFCLIYYSGHGSFSTAPKEFWTETDGLNESFVCLDSRSPSGRDLVDKEMAFLIWKTFNKKRDVTVVVITDCCHSGTITKGLIAREDKITERMLPPDYTPRTIKEYYGYGEDGYVFSHGNTRVSVKEHKHIHFASSLANQTSKEKPLGGQARGAFTYSMLQVLNACKGRISYRELVDKTTLAVMNQVHDQLPGLNVNGISDTNLRTAEKNKYFLSHDAATGNTGHVVFYGPEGWCINAGAINGVCKGDPVVVDGKIDTVVVRVMADRAVILQKPAFQPGKNYPATIIPGMWKPLAVAIAPNVPAHVRALIEQACAGVQSPLVSIEQTGTHTIRALKDSVSIFLSGSDQPLIEPIVIDDIDSARLFVSNIETISRWGNILRLDNPATTITNAHYNINLMVAEEACNDEDSSFKERDIKPLNDLFYKQKEGGWCYPAFKLSFENKTNHRLWFSCAYLLSDFSILGEYYEPIAVEGRKTINLFFVDKNGEHQDVLHVKIEDDLGKKGYREITEYLKIFISQDTLDKTTLSYLSQEGVKPALVTKSISKGSKGAVREEETPMIARKDWATQTIGLRIIKPATSV